MHLLMVSTIRGSLPFILAAPVLEALYVPHGAHLSFLKFISIYVMIHFLPALVFLVQYLSVVNLATLQSKQTYRAAGTNCILWDWVPFPNQDLFNKCNYLATFVTCDMLHD